MRQSNTPEFHKFFDRMDGIEFEEYCAKLLTRNGFKHVEITGASGDQGIDILCDKHGKTYGIQCKNYTGKVGNKAVQEAFAGKCFYDLDYGAVLTNNYFTKAAVLLSEETDVLLWDRDQLLKFKSHNRLWGVVSGLLLSGVIIGGLTYLIYYLQQLF